jgi:hypothetical protein
MCAQFLNCIHPSTPFTDHLSPCTDTNAPPNRTCSALLFSDFVEEKEERKKRKK